MASDTHSLLVHRNIKLLKGLPIADSVMGLPLPLNKTFNKKYSDEQNQ